MSRDRYGNVDGVHRNIAVRHVEGYGREVRVRVRELLRRKPHSRRARVGLRRRRVAAEREVGFFIKLVAHFHVVALDGVRFAVIVHGIGMSRDRYGNVDGVHRHIAVRHVEGYCREVRVCVHKLLRRKPHSRRARVGLRRRSVAGEREVRFIVERVSDLRVVAGHGMRLAVVVRGRGVSRDRDLRVYRSDSQIFAGVVDRIVIARRQRALRDRVGPGVIAAFAGKRPGDRIRSDQSTVRICQRGVRFAVVFGFRFGVYGQRRRLDDKLRRSGRAAHRNACAVSARVLVAGIYDIGGLD